METNGKKKKRTVMAQRAARVLMGVSLAASVACFELMAAGLTRAAAVCVLVGMPGLMVGLLEKGGAA